MTLRCIEKSSTWVFQGPIIFLLFLAAGRLASWYIKSEVSFYIPWIHAWRVAREKVILLAKLPLRSCRGHWKFFTRPQGSEVCQKVINSSPSELEAVHHQHARHLSHAGFQRTQTSVWDLQLEGDLTNLLQTCRMSKWSIGIPLFYLRIHQCQVRWKLCWKPN